MVVVGFYMYCLKRKMISPMYIKIVKIENVKAVKGISLSLFS